MDIRYVLLNAFRMSGSVRSVLNQAEAMAAAGHQVEIVSAVRDRERMFFRLPKGVRLTALVDTRTPDPDDGPAVLVPRAEGQYRVLTRRVEDALVAYLRSVPGGVLVGSKPALNVLIGRYAPRSVVRVGQEHRNLAQRGPALRELIVREYPRLDAVVTLTDADRRDYEAAFRSAPARADGAGAADKPVVVAIPNFLTAWPGRRWWPRRPVVVSAGRLSREKGFDLLIRAFLPVARDHPRWRLHIYGGGRKEAALRERIARYELTDSARLMGATPRLGRRLAAASLFVLSSRAEGFPMVLLEAMACGLPVVSFDCPHGPAEIIRPGRDGLLVPPGDVAGLSAAMSRLIADPDRRREMGAAARARAAEFTASRTVPMWEHLFQRLLDRTTADRQAADLAGPARV